MSSVDGGASIFGGYMHSGDRVINSAYGTISVVSENIELGGDKSFDATKCALKRLGFDLPRTQNGVYWATTSAYNMQFTGYTIFWTGFAWDSLNYTLLNKRHYANSSDFDDVSFKEFMVTIWHEVKGHNVDEEEVDGPMFNDKYERPVRDAYDTAKKNRSWAGIAKCCQIGQPKP